ncbi:unnamed protein product [Absidia cylindrospora]
MYYSSISQLFVLGTGILSATIVTAQQQNSTTQPDNAPSNPQVQITSPNDFCLFLPPQPGADVATTEDDGIAFCMNPATVQGSQVFPQGFITAAHYQQTESYTQITGFFDRTKYNLSPDDFGGQYDSHAKHKPTGASCQNFPYFVSLIEPSNNRFCIRCCNDTEDCKTGISQRGCARVISPGNYDDNNQFDSVPPQDSASGSSASASAGPTASASASSGSQPSASGSSSAPLLLVNLMFLSMVKLLQALLIPVARSLLLLLIKLALLLMEPKLKAVTMYLVMATLNKSLTLHTTLYWMI